jgi:uncharacterized membrane protein (DUF485 family)
MLSSTQTLPDGYIQTHEIDLAKNKGLAILLNIIGFFIFILSFILLGSFANWMHSELSSSTITLRGDLPTIVRLLALLVMVALLMVVHELIHGLFFWIFTHSKPVYALHLAYAYAAAPDWYIPINQYRIVGLGPLVIMDAIGLLLILTAPTSWILMIIFLVAINTGGAVGDMLIIARSFRMSADSLVKDKGDGVCYFEAVRIGEVLQK